jgi:hypothetical protein
MLGIVSIYKIVEAPITYVAYGLLLYAHPWFGPIACALMALPHGIKTDFFTAELYCTSHKKTVFSLRNE